MVATGVSIWAILRFRQKGTLLRAPKPFAFAAPTLLVRSDFPDPDKPWLLAVFTATKCQSCAAVWQEAQKMIVAEPVTSRVSLAKIDSLSQKKLHHRYRIEAVPLTVAADQTGEVQACYLGLLAPAALSELASLFRGEVAGDSTD